MKLTAEESITDTCITAASHLYRETSLFDRHLIRTTFRWRWSVRRRPALQNEAEKVTWNIDEAWGKWTSLSDFQLKVFGYMVTDRQWSNNVWLPDPRSPMLREMHAIR
jgi:hypothetical protein